MQTLLCDQCKINLVGQKWLEIHVIRHDAMLNLREDEDELTSYHDICDGCFVKIGLLKAK